MATTTDSTRYLLDSEFERLLSSSPTTTRSTPGRAASSRSDGTTTTADMPRPTVITLDVAGRIFKVSTDILIAESGLFQRQLSTRYNWTPQRDGTYFIDADPTMFQHLLRFMRRPSVFPLHWSKNKGFDYDLYQRLQAEAEYFQMDALSNWIKDKKYLEAIKTRIYQPVTRELKSIPCTDIVGDMSEDWHYVSKIRKIYVCPRGIRVHYGKRDACGRACREYQGDDDTEYDEEDYLEVVSVKREVVFDEEVCQMG